MSEICHNLHFLFNRLPAHRFPFDGNQIPRNGIYVIFEAGETAHGTNRIVRIGTHTGADQLHSRLQQHFVKENKDRSIFRKNIGRAILNRDHDPFLTDWEVDLATKDAKLHYSSLIDSARQKQIEQEVSKYIQANLSFAVIPVDSKDERLTLESKFISTVSLCEECRPSHSWLGQYSPKEKIRESGLWLVNELYKQGLSTSEYAAFEKTIATR